MSRIVKGKKVYKLGGSFAEIAIVDKKISDEKLKKFINLKIT